MEKSVGRKSSKNKFSAKKLEKIIKKLYLKLKELLKNTQKFQMLHCIALSCILGKLKYLHNMVTSSKCPSVPRCPPSNVPQYGDIPTELGRDGEHIFQIYHTSGNPRKNPQRWKGPWDTGKVGQQRYMKFILMVFSKKKFLIWGKWAISGPELAHPCNSRSTLIAHELTPKIYGFLVTSECLLSRKIWWAVWINSVCPKLRYYTD